MAGTGGRTRIFTGWSIYLFAAKKPNMWRPVTGLHFATEFIGKWEVLEDNWAGWEVNLGGVYTVTS